MSAETWRGVATRLCLLATVMASQTGKAEEAVPVPPSREAEIRVLITKMTNPVGVMSMKLAPDGKHVAVIGWTGRANALMLLDTKTLQARQLIGPENRPGWSGIFQPISMHWISNEKLAVDFNDGDCVLIGLDGQRGRVLGKKFVRVIPPKRPDDLSEWVIVGAEGFFGSTQLRRVNVRTGESIDVPIGLPGDLSRAVFDHRGRLRAATTLETHWLKPGAKINNWYRRDEDSPWQQVAQGNVTDDLWQPIAVPDDSDSLAVLSRDGRDTWALFSFDVATGRTTELRVGHATEDLIYGEEDGNQTAIRVVTHGLKLTTHWFDARWHQLQRSIDQALPDMVNLLNGDPQGKVLVYSYSDREPGRWMLLDTSTMTLRELARKAPDIDVGSMRPMRMLTYKANDGMTIPAYLTVPAGTGEKPSPMVVYIHGGPLARDEWGWSADVQLLAAAGYAVFQPQFRGSTGFGRKFEQAGYRQWGLAMQDDVTEGVKAMIAQGIADPARICIYGASYGGYAALWGLVKTPELYRCGVSLAGVTDIGERFSDRSDTNASKAGREWLRFAVGDHSTMAAQFDAVSPVKHADRIKVPVLLAHGEEDIRVPIGHARRMAKALKATGGTLETHWYEEEGHGLSLVSNIRAFNAALLDFLDRHIGPASAAAAQTRAKAANTASAVANPPPTPP